MKQTTTLTVYLIDNYDSFTYNLYQYVGETLQSACAQGQLRDFEIIVKRNNQTTLAAIATARPDRLIISPGPGSPDNPDYFGVCGEVITQLGPRIPLLGVCLGMQGIVHCFGGRVVKAPVPMHGKISTISHNGKGIFTDIPDQLEVMRYHSLMAQASSLPDCLRLTAVLGSLPAHRFDHWQGTAETNQLEIMGVRHRHYPIHGIQFHPESFATEGGRELIANFLLKQPIIATNQ